MDLVARQAISAIEGHLPENIEEYCDPTTEKYRQMTEWVGKYLNLTTFKYQNIHDMLDAIGIEPCKVCTHCWTGKE
jgi:amidophosphoribosyltransferase